MHSIKRVTVFCGSSPGSGPVYTNAAAELGRYLAHQKIALVYGGGRVGLMGTIANAVLSAEGHVIGVIPEALVAKEVAHQSLPDLRIVSSMHERKALMADLSDGFIALPGGCGTFEEFFEVLTWAHLGLHCKPCAILNVNDFYASILAQMDKGVIERFIRPEHREMIIVSNSIPELILKMETYRAPDIPKWIDRDQS
jgi:uncharacterized protein (TIGR00730 family)